MKRVTIFSIFFSAILLTGFAATNSHAFVSDLCVNPTNTPACKATIQDAVDVAQDGDTIIVYPKADGMAYNETVVVDTEGLTIKGKEPEQSNPYQKYSKKWKWFKKKHQHKTKDPGFQFPWSKKRFPWISDREMKKLDPLKEMQQCPLVRVDVCETAAIPNACGQNDPNTDDDSDDAAGFVINASGVTIQGITIRHAGIGVKINQGGDQATINNICTINNRVNGVRAGRDEFEPDNEQPEPTDDVQVLHSRFFSTGASTGRRAGISIIGDHALVKHNLMQNAEGVHIVGDSSEATYNVVNVTEQSAGIQFFGDGHQAGWNFFRNTGASGIDTSGSKITIQRNFFMGADQSDQAIDASGPFDGAAINLTIVKNVIRNLGHGGIDLNRVEDSLVGWNLLEELDDNSQPGIRLDDSHNNRVVYNQVRLAHQAGIAIGPNRNAPSNNNLLQGNLVEYSGTSGINVRNGDNNIIDRNTIRNNNGEGVSNLGIQGGVGPGATNTVITDNEILNNRTDVCNEVADGATIATFTGNNFNTGGTATPCVVEQSNP